jgi:transcriptional regulator with XRE-family HTH domain
VPLKSRWRPVKLSSKLLQIRKDLKLSQDGMLRRLGIQDEFDRRAISSYERGKAEPPLPILLLYAEVAGVSTDVLIDDARELPRKIPANKK